MAGYCEAAGDARYNSVVCVTGDGVLGNHRKVHQPLSEDASFASGTVSTPSTHRSAGSG